jgi:hypothetical protein
MAQNKCVMLRFFSESQRGNTGIDAGLGEIRGRINSFPAPTPILQIGQGSGKVSGGSVNEHDFPRA